MSVLSALMRLSVVLAAGNAVNASPLGFRRLASRSPTGTVTCSGPAHSCPTPTVFYQTDCPPLPFTSSGIAVSFSGTTVTVKSCLKDPGTDSAHPATISGLRVLPGCAGTCIKDCCPTDVQKNGVPYNAVIATYTLPADVCENSLCVYVHDGVSFVNNPSSNRDPVCPVTGGDGTCNYCSFTFTIDYNGFDCGPEATECRDRGTCLDGVCGTGTAINGGGACTSIPGDPGECKHDICVDGNCARVNEDDIPCGPEGTECRDRGTCSGGMCGMGSAINEGGACTSVPGDPGECQHDVCDGGDCSRVEYTITDNHKCYTAVGCCDLDTFCNGAATCPATQFKTDKCATLTVEGVSNTCKSCTGDIFCKGSIDCPISSFDMSTLGCA